MARLLHLSLLVAAHALVGCESSEDPFTGGDDAGSDRDTSSRDTGGDETGTTDTGDDTGGDETGTTDTGDDAGTRDTGDDTGGDDTGTTDTGGDFTCGAGVVFTGQVYVDDDPEPLEPNGGAPRFEPWGTDYDAGLAAIVDAMPESDEDEPVTGTWTITDATVAATDYNTDATQRAQRSFWLQDGNATVQVFFFYEEDGSHVDMQPEFSIKTGQRISGTVTSVGNFRGMVQVNSADGDAWTLTSEGNEVYIRDIVDEDVTSDMILDVVRVTGRLTELIDEDCGGARCYTLSYGEDRTIEFRTESSTEYTDVGSCVTFVGPVRGFYGTPSLDTQNFDWLWTYRED